MVNLPGIHLQAGRALLSLGKQQMTGNWDLMRKMRMIRPVCWRTYAAGRTGSALPGTPGMPWGRGI